MDKVKVKKLLDKSYVLECFVCQGHGAVEDGIFCIKPASNCCGGCYAYSQCEVCSGTGEIEAVDEEMQDQFMMLSAINHALDKFKEIRKTFKNLVSEDTQAEYELIELLKQEARYEKLYDNILTEIKEILL